ncbi:MAG: hypothetical protein AB8C46_24510 [Burkholderiaceae bacterium]
MKNLTQFSRQNLLSTIAVCSAITLSACGGGSEESTEPLSMAQEEVNPDKANPLSEPAETDGAQSTAGSEASSESEPSTPEPSQSNPPTNETPETEQQQESTNESAEPEAGNTSSGSEGGQDSGGGSGESTGGAPPPTYVPPVVSVPSTFSGPIPSWRQGMNVWEWRSISGSSLSSVAPDVMPQGRLASRIGAWNGLAADTSTNKLFIAGAGGHFDYAGNEAYSINLSDDSPRWQILNQPTPDAQVVWEASYYADGRPSSTHTYYALQYVTRLNRIFRVGSGSNWGSGNHKDWNMNAFNVTVNDWDPAGTWPVVDDSRPRLGYAICKNPESEEIYAAGNYNLRRFDPQTGVWSTLARFPQNGSSTLRRACVVDHSRNRVVFLGDRYRMNVGGGLIFNIASSSFENIDFNGPAVSALMSADEGYAFLEKTNAMIHFVGGVGSQVLNVNPVTWEVTVQATTGGDSMPNASNGVHTRFQYLPGLGGFAYYPSPASGIWFLASE